MNAELLKNPIARWGALLSLLGSLIGGVTWAVQKVEASDAKADSALTTAKEVKAGVDMFIKLQKEANDLKREEMQAQGIRVQTKSVSVSESTTQSESSTEAHSRTVEVLASGTVVVEYIPDSLRNGVIRKGDTIFVPRSTQDSAATRPR